MQDIGDVSRGRKDTWRHALGAKEGLVGFVSYLVVIVIASSHDHKVSPEYLFLGVIDKHFDPPFLSDRQSRPSTVWWKLICLSMPCRAATVRK